MSDLRLMPSILVFDSGIGGLSVYQEIRQKIPHANYLYLFDNEAFPYGDKTEAFLIERVQTVINKMLLRYQPDIIVIACNTASTLCLNALRETISTPIVGVVPAIKPAVAYTRNGVIGLLATKGTIQRAYTHQLIAKFASEVKVELLGISELAMMAENKLHGKPVDMSQLESLMMPWLKLTTSPDTIILGCTHYPFIRDELQQIFPHATLIDSGYAIANRVERLLESTHQSLLDESISEPLLSNSSSKIFNTVLSTQPLSSDDKLLSQLDSFCFSDYNVLKV